MTQTLPLIDVARLPNRSMRDAETYLKRTTFKLEQAAVRHLFALYRDAYRDLTLARGTRADTDTLVAARVARLRRDVLLLLGSTSLAAWLGGYYGKLWLLDMTTREDVRIVTQRLNALSGSAPEAVLDALYGQAFRATVDVELDALAVNVRRVLVVGAALAAPALLKRLRKTMGVDGSYNTPHGDFNRVQVLTRTGVQSAMNTGSLTALQANAATVDALTWLTARDEKVCPICRPLDGKRYPLNTIERPPIHPQCRCTLVPDIADTLAVADDRPLRQAFPQWVLTIGIQRDVDGFLNP